MKHSYRTTFIIFLLLVFAQNALAKIIKVPNDSPTITNAIQQAQSGDIIKVCQGTYFEHLKMKKAYIEQNSLMLQFKST